MTLDKRDVRKPFLILGAGLVAQPLVSYLLRETPHALRIAALEFQPALRELAGHPRVELVELDGSHANELTNAAVSGASVVISLLPPPLHGNIARLCVENRRSLVTTSYVSEEINGLDSAAREAGVLLLKECGFHPGLNHMLAMRVIDEIHAQGGTVVRYDSYAGGLPAPDSNDNPWGYKFSWSPRGVLSAALEPATLLEDGKPVRVPGGQIFERGTSLSIAPLGHLEAYPNRDALKYRVLYGIPHVRTMRRCTVRYAGHCATWSAMIRLGLLRPDGRDALGSTYADMMRALAGVADRNEDPRRAVAERVGLAARAAVLDRFAWLGLFDERPLPADCNGPADALLALMTERMAFKNGEHDAVVLYDEFEIETSSSQRRTRNALLFHRGRIGVESAMAMLVGLPAAVAARFIVEGRLAGAGVRLPIHAAVYEPILDELCRIGVSVC